MLFCEWKASMLLNKQTHQLNFYTFITVAGAVRTVTSQSISVRPLQRNVSHVVHALLQEQMADIHHQSKDHSSMHYVSSQKYSNERIK